MKRSRKMMTYVVDRQGRKIGVILPIEELKKLLAEVEELESIRAFDAAKASREKAIPFQKAMKDLKRLRK